MIKSKIIAHRGLSSLAPENTLAAISLAAKAGIQWVEIDAIALSDGSIVMWHDNSVDRCSDGAGAMSTHTKESITTLDCGSWFSPQYAGEKMATIEQAIDHIQALGLGLNLEFKLYQNSAQTVVAPVLNYLNEHWQDFDKLIISSFDQEALTYCYETNPHLKLGKLYESIPDNWLEQMQSINAISCHCYYKPLTQQQVSALKEHNYAVYCYTANDPALVEEHWDWGIDAIFTDYPQRFNDKLNDETNSKLSALTAQHTERKA